MKEGYIKLIDCNAEKLSELSLLDESQVGGIQTTQEDGEASSLSVQQAGNPREVGGGTLMEGGSTDGSLIFYSTSDDEMPSMVPARRTSISIPKRKTARKKVNGKPTKLLSSLQRGERQEKDGDSKSSSEENWSDLKELVLTNQSPSLKVVCNQLKSPELEGDGPASAGQKDRREDTSEKDERGRKRGGSEGKFGEINSTDVGKNKEDGFNQTSSKDPNEIQTGDGLQQMAKASVAKSLVYVEKKRKFEGEVGFTEINVTKGEVSLTPDEPQMTTEDKQEKKSRNVLWEGTLRQTPKKVEPYQVTPPSARSKKKKPPEKSMPSAKPDGSTMTPASRVIKPYRNVATPSPLATTPNANQQPSTSKSAQKLTVKPKFALGQLVWGHMKGFPWWPGKVVHHHAMKRREPPAEGLVIIQWFGDMKFSQLKDIQVKGFENYAECVNVMFLQKRNLYKKAMFQAFTLAAAQMQKTFNDEVKEYPVKRCFM
ncbi:putative DNA (cytosine-5)-methyltransferase 3A [Apostichopus japonicus]|uniref:Putative DNA (Cytosine-5)-methyltransferase 3A n=1 Tax=Stichopus japonicus TaxID=307972 RepID=A0A2G8JR16_STIJA|nr:putative DNA (cytosine-5)-methyltransferase 3A [Apostichopus japonicus]